MNEQTLRIILVVLGTLLAIIGFLLAFYFKRGVDSIDGLNKTVGELRDKLSGLSAKFIANEDIDKINKDACTERHAKIGQDYEKHERRLDEHGRKLEEHKEMITEIKTAVELMK